MSNETQRQPASEIEAQAQRLFQELYPSTLAFICAMSMNPDLNANDREAQDKAANLLSQIALELYFEVVLSPQAKESDSEWLAIQPETEDDTTQAYFWIMSGLATQPHFADRFIQEVNTAITVQGKLSLDEEPDSMPQ